MYGEEASSRYIVTAGLVAQGGGFVSLYCTHLPLHFAWTYEERQGYSKGK